MFPKTNVQKLNVIEKDQCEGELTVDECENVIKEMAIKVQDMMDLQLSFTNTFGKMLNT